MTFDQQPFDRTVDSDGGRAFGNRISVLAEVTFKWLMAGQGWWIDTARFYKDAGYAAGLLELARTSTSAALRESAEMVEAEMQMRSAGAQQREERLLKP